MRTFSTVWYGDRRNSTGDLGTDKLFTGQRLDDTGLYYYGARYYDPTIGRFISADTIVSDFTNPQALNRYSYVLNNPLKYVDPSGHLKGTVAIAGETYQLVEDNDGNHHLVAPDGSETASVGLAELIEMTAGEMDLRGDYSYGGDWDEGATVRVYPDTDFSEGPIPVDFVPEGSSVADQLAKIEAGGASYSYGTYVRHGIYKGIPLQLEQTVLEEAFHAYERMQKDSKGIIDVLNRY